MPRIQSTANIKQYVNVVNTDPTSLSKLSFKIENPVTKDWNYSNIGKGFYLNFANEDGTNVTAETASNLPSFINPLYTYKGANFDGNSGQGINITDSLHAINEEYTKLTIKLQCKANSFASWRSLLSKGYSPSNSFEFRLLQSQNVFLLQLFNNYDYGANECNFVFTSPTNFDNSTIYNIIISLDFITKEKTFVINGVDQISNCSFGGLLSFSSLNKLRANIGEERKYEIGKTDNFSGWNYDGIIWRPYVSTSEYVTPLQAINEMASFTDNSSSVLEIIKYHNSYSSKNNYVEINQKDFAPIIFKTNATERWSFSSSGTLEPYLNSTYDFGSVSKRINRGYFSNLSINTANSTNPFEMEGFFKHSNGFFQTSGTHILYDSNQYAEIALALQQHTYSISSDWNYSNISKGFYLNFANENLIDVLGLETATGGSNTYNSVLYGKKALTFNGTSDYLDITNTSSNSINSQLKKITLRFQFELSQLNNNDYFIVFSRERFLQSVGELRFYIAKDGSGNSYLGADLYNSNYSPTYITIKKTTNITLNTPHSVIFSLDLENKYVTFIYDTNDFSSNYETEGAAFSSFNAIIQNNGGVTNTTIGRTAYNNANYYKGKLWRLSASFGEYLNPNDASNEINSFSSANYDFAIKKYNSSHTTKPNIVEIQQYQNAGIHFRTNDLDRWQISESGHLEPLTTNSFNLGSSTKFINRAYINSLSLNTTNSTHPVEIDGRVRILTGGLEVERDSQPVLTITSYSAAASDGPVINLVRKNGTATDSYSAVTSGQSLGGFHILGATASNTISSLVQGRLSAEASENWSNTNRGMRWLIETTPNGSFNRVTSAILDQDSSFTLGSVAGTGTGAFYAGSGTFTGLAKIGNNLLHADPTDSQIGINCINDTSASTGYIMKLQATGDMKPFLVERYDSTAGGIAGNTALRARGTPSTPSKVLTDDVLGGVYAGGYYDDGAGNFGFTPFSTAIRLKANQDYSSSSINGSYISFETTANNTAAGGRRSVGFFDNDGSFTVGTTKGAGSGQIYAGAINTTGDIQVLVGQKLKSSNTTNFIDMDSTGNITFSSRGSVQNIIDNDSTSSVNIWAVYKNNVSSEILRADLNRNFGFNGNSFGSGVQVMFIGDATTNPSSAPSGGTIFYSESGNLKKYTKLSESIVGCIFTQTTDVSVINTVSETNIIGTGTGTTTIAANLFSIGKTIKIKSQGYIKNTGTPTIQIKLKAGSTVLLDSGAITMSTLSDTNTSFNSEFLVTCRTAGNSGTISPQGSFTYSDSSQNLKTIPLFATSTITLNTTSSQALALTVTWGTADTNNAITSTNTTIEILN